MVISGLADHGILITVECEIPISFLLVEEAGGWRGFLDNHENLAPMLARLESFSIRFRDGRRMRARFDRHCRDGRVAFKLLAAP